MEKCFWLVDWSYFTMKRTKPSKIPLIILNEKRWKEGIHNEKSSFIICIRGKKFEHKSSLDQGKHQCTLKKSRAMWSL